MAITVSELKRWLDSTENAAVVWIEEDKLVFQSVVDEYKAYLEVGEKV